MARTDYLHTAKKQAFYAFQNAVDNKFTRKYIDENTIWRDELQSNSELTTELWWIDEQEQIRYREPVHIGDLPEDITERPRTVQTVDAFVTEFESAQIVGPNGLTMAKDGRFIAENSLGFSKRLQMAMLRSITNGTVPARRPTDRSFPRVISLVGPWSRNYYHWILDYVTKLRHLRQYCNGEREIPALLLPHNASEWMLEAVRLAGFGEAEWLFWDGQRATIDELVVPSLSWNTESDKFAYEVYTKAPAALRWLKREFKSNIPKLPSNVTHDRIFVTREGSTERRILNQTAVQPVLKEYGFETIRPEEFSITEQIAIFSEANVVLGVTGAGLVNTIFSDDPTLIILYGADTHPAFYALGEALGFDTAVAQCVTKGEDLHVDPDRLETIFTKLDLV